MDIIAKLSAKVESAKVIAKEYPTLIERVTILQVRPASPKLNFKTSDGAEHSRSNVMYRFESGEHKGQIVEDLFPTEWFKTNGVTSFTGCEAYLTLALRKAKRDSAAHIADPTKGVAKGDEVLSVQAIEFTFNNLEALARIGANLNINRN